MIRFDYTYFELSDVISRIPRIYEYSIEQYIILGVITGIVLFLVFIVLPILYSIKSYRDQEHKKRSRKNLLKQIALQKDIEDSIESEVS